MNYDVIAKLEAHARAMTNKEVRLFVQRWGKLQLATLCGILRNIPVWIYIVQTASQISIDFENEGCF